MFPKSLYERLPLIYALAGILSLMKLNHDLGILSGVLLIAAALLVTYWRYSYRRLALSS